LSFEAVTAFEVMEHIMDPLKFVKDTLNKFKTKTIIFSTELFKDTPPDVKKWWYYSPNTGQHVTFYKKGH